MKKFLTQEGRKGESGPSGPANGGSPGNAGEDDNAGPGFPNVKACLMIFTGEESNGSRRVAKVTHREVFAAEPATPSFLRWSKLPITFDRSDHPSYVPRPGRFPLVVDPIVDETRLTKVLMDGGSGLNVMYAETLDAMGVDRVRIRPSGSLFHGVVPGKRAVPIGQIDLPVMFGTPMNFRTETLTFEVVGFPGVYHKF